VSKTGDFGMLNDLEACDQPGRKFNYTEKEFLEAYFGRDGMRRLAFDSPTEKSKSEMFGYNEAWKHKYPVE